MSLPREHGLIDAHLEPISPEIYTQKPLRGGWGGLAMPFVGDGWSDEVWLEVNVAANGHGEQDERRVEPD